MKKLLTGLTLVAIGSLLSLCVGCVSAGWRTTAGVMHASDTTGAALAKLARSRVTAKRSGLSPGELAACRTWRAHLEHWQQYARPAIRSGVAGSAAVLRVGGKGWRDKLRGAGCGLWQALQSWGNLLPDKGTATRGALSWLDTGACRQVSRSAGGVAAGLTLGLEVFRWLVKVLGSPTDKLRAEIAAWLASPAADETEPVLQALRERCP
jgi:hypothetical protein